MAEGVTAARSLHLPPDAMNRRFGALVLSLLASLAPLAACAGDDDPPAQGAEDLGEQDKEEVARSVGAALSRSFSSDDGLAVTSIDVAGGAPPAWLSEAEVGVYVGQLLGLTVDVDVACTDAGGAAMDVCGPSAAEAAIDASIEGELSLFGWTGSVGLSVGWQLSGLQEDEIRVEGSAAIELGSEFEDWFQPVTHTATFTISAEVAATVRRSDSLITSGSVELAIEYLRERSDEGTVASFEFTVDAVLEDGQASVTIGGLGFRIDLATGAATRM